MARLDGEQLFARAKKAVAEVELNKDLFRDCEEYTIPFRNSFDKDANDKSHNRNTKCFDSTAMIAKNNFVNTMISQATPPFTKWVELAAGPVLTAGQEVDGDAYNKALEGINELIFAIRNASNFNIVIPEMFHDVAISTGTLLVLEGTKQNPINYVAVPLSQMGFLEGKYGNIDFYVRKNSVPPRLIKQLWPKAVIPTELQRLIDDAGKNDNLVELHECFYYDYTDLLWRYEVLYCGGKNIIYNNTSLTCPVVTWRWSKVPGFVTGIGPLMMALSDIKTINKMQELSLRLAALNVFGVYTVVNDANFNPNTAVIQPGAFIPVSRNGGPEGASIQALPSAGNFQVEEFMINELKTQIKQTMLDNRLPVDSNVQRTAFETAQVVKQLQVDAGAAYGRFLHEFTANLIKREVEILSNLKLIEIPPDFTIDNFLIKVQVTSPIAFRQNIEDVEKFTQTFTILQGINPELAQLSLELSTLPGWIGNKLGASPSLLKTKDMIEQELQNIAQAQAAQMAIQMEQQMQQGAA